MCFADADRDGAGSATTIASADLSYAEPGASTTAHDCDDLAPPARPGAQEVVADGIDQDCDAGDACFVDATTTTVPVTS